MGAHPSPILTQLELPEWMAPPAPAPYYDLDVVKRSVSVKQAQRQIEEMTFETLMEEALETIASGEVLIPMFRNDPRQPHLGRFMSWVMRDEKRKAAYYEAEMTGAEIIGQQTIDIADADDSIEDVARSTLRINTRKWKMGIFNRARFGDIKQIEQNVRVDLSGAMSAAQERIDRARTVDTTSRRID